MNAIDNPYTPGAGVPPAVMAGRDDIIHSAYIAYNRTLKGNFAKCQLMLGLRGVGKTVLLNRINNEAEEAGCQTAFVEASPDTTFPELIIPRLHSILLKLNRKRKAGEDITNAFNRLSGFASMFRVKYGDLEIGMTKAPATGKMDTDLTELLVSIGAAAQNRNTVAILFIDEIQYLKQKELEALIIALHKISQKKLPFLFFGAGLPQIAKLAGEAKSYAERLFDFISIGELEPKQAKKAIIDPARKYKVSYEPEAITEIINQTEGYPFFLQVWGSNAWDKAKDSSITLDDIKKATKQALSDLDNGFYKVRYERLTVRQQQYVLAMAKVPSLPAKSGEIAHLLNMSVRKAAPIRDELIKKGMIYSPAFGLTTFTVPKFDAFLRRKILN
ncbi:MAG: ATP-binding protein [Bacteroidetes bacterium]|nr:ATP-binding protein [Bacteroidota bacterium]